MRQVYLSDALERALAAHRQRKEALAATRRDREVERARQRQHRAREERRAHARTLAAVRRESLARTLLGPPISKRTAPHLTALVARARREFVTSVALDGVHFPLRPRPWGAAICDPETGLPLVFVAE